MRKQNTQFNAMPKTWTDTSSEKMVRWRKACEEMLCITRGGESQVSTHLSERPNPAALTLSVEQRAEGTAETHSLMPGGRAALRGGSTAYSRDKHGLTVSSRNHTPWGFPRWTGNVCPNKNPHVNVYRSFIHICQKAEATEMSFQKWINCGPATQCHIIQW